ncbi:hypothetical protein NIES2135_54020 [Leptolyngbya boryana NIES-2135]|jgi:hypothetical protein|uniref:Uncharacterized protein n=1 Tax=Leptolyngbya boryana NIES-2135 TaxID=1973484 RepID=A0A1Z4JP78_LEPBY|nr:MULTISPECIES: hypothetical protein [Leptolyngbya]BAY58529.1 hypothetical protein NIES2135_54020 [Leptolyngbya boryana NIES-2135]MBD2370789.1 hypothetical protein [Leptolyngbya sp. FACHB-161]MBD2377058.1 hypothetical protein [Leptolyngbya sp. FACHB-238]MBD2401501.1 hypothetical protein [Leptolyngbya sp. FACHB-239]MBD2408053.1 hypothetical protein [Leptolyngbya sp. FACHB-402]
MSNFSPGTKVDVRHCVSDLNTREIVEHWISGYSIFDPSNKSISIPSRLRPRIGEVLIVSESSPRPFRKKLSDIRLHNPKTSKPFGDVYPRSSGAILIEGATIESEEEDLQIGLEPPEEVFDD